MVRHQDVAVEFELVAAPVERKFPKEDFGWSRLLEHRDTFIGVRCQKQKAALDFFSGGYFSHPPGGRCHRARRVGFSWHCDFPEAGAVGSVWERLLVFTFLQITDHYIKNFFCYVGFFLLDFVV